MYSQNDLDEAVAAGAIAPESAMALRAFIERQRSAPSADEEHFRLITGFNDIFVAIAAAILLFAMGWIGQSIGQNLGLQIEDGPSPLAPALVAATAWGLALFFTARRRMALPSILLLLAFVAGVIAAVGFTEVLIVGEERFDGPDSNEVLAGVIAAIAAAAGAMAAWLHWRRFRVPITVAAGAASVSGIVVALVASSLDSLGIRGDTTYALILLLGVGVFLYAMRWDSSDPGRVTRRSDVAFWLHLLAAPMIVHPIFTLLGLNDGDATIAEGLAVVAIYIALGIAALAIDRRALLVSALAYVLYALNELFEQFGAVSLNIALTALVIGSALLLLSAFWHQARAGIVERLPDGVRRHLPTTARTVSPQPA